jgi:hypothetical protein
MAKNDDKPVQDLGVPKPDVAFRAGGKDQGDVATRKTALSDSGTIGFIARGAGRAGYVHEAPQKSGKVPGFADLEYGPRPMPREIPVSSAPGHTGSYVRFLDGHTEVHRERPGLVEEMNDPYTSDDDREDIKQEISDRDEIHKHEWWCSTWQTRAISVMCAAGSQRSIQSVMSSRLAWARPESTRTSWSRVTRPRPTTSHRAASRARCAPGIQRWCILTSYPMTRAGHATRCSGRQRATAGRWTLPTSW